MREELVMRKVSLRGTADCQRRRRAAEENIRLANSYSRMEAVLSA